MIEEHYPARVRIVEVSPRDGLQNEPAAVDVATKVALIEALANAGLQAIECGSFVSEKRVPQMANTAEVLSALRRSRGVDYSVLVPNLQGLEAAVRSEITNIAIFAAASETFSQHNIQCSIAESLSRFRAVTEQALAHGMRVRGYVSCVLGCPYEGIVAPEAVVRVAKALLDMGCYEISLGDTIGVGTPLAAQALIRQVAEHVAISRLAVHFHDTYGQALANILAALQLGVAVIDAAVSGLGGCPYAPGATGNVATEDVVYMLNGMHIETGIDLDKLTAAGQTISAALGRESKSKAAAATRRKSR
ncbi:MAG TPA: hydroxymethylglutaryl-CoA lyase [Bryobacteraceae bacterium]